ASCGKDRSVKVVEAATGKGRFTFSGMNEEVLAVAISPDGRSVVSSGLEPGLYWWNAETGQRVRVQAGHSAGVEELCFGKDGTLLASAGADRTVRLWDGAGGSPRRVIAAGSLVYAVALAPDGKRVAAGSFDGLVRVWDTSSGRPLLTLLSLPPRGEVADWLALTPEGYMSASADLTAVCRWRMNGQPVAGDVLWPSLRDPKAVVNIPNRH